LLDTQVAVWLVIALPLFAPFANVTLNEPVAVVVEFETAFAAVGAAGAPTIIGAVDTESGPVPREFVAATVNV
jgi:hypothetical protein